MKKIKSQKDEAPATSLMYQRLLHESEINSQRKLAIARALNYFAFLLINFLYFSYRASDETSQNERADSIFHSYYSPAVNTTLAAGITGIVALIQFLYRSIFSAENISDQPLLKRKAVIREQSLQANSRLKWSFILPIALQAYQYYASINNWSNLRGRAQQLLASRFAMLPEGHGFSTHPCSQLIRAMQQGVPAKNYLPLFNQVFNTQLPPAVFSQVQLHDVQELHCLLSQMLRQQRTNTYSEGTLLVGIVGLLLYAIYQFGLPWLSQQFDDQRFNALETFCNKNGIGLEFYHQVDNSRRFSFDTDAMCSGKKISKSHLDELWSHVVAGDNQQHSYHQLTGIPWCLPARLEKVAAFFPAIIRFESVQRQLIFWIHLNVLQQQLSKIITTRLFMADKFDPHVEILFKNAGDAELWLKALQQPVTGVAVIQKGNRCQIRCQDEKLLFSLVNLSMDRPSNSASSTVRQRKAAKTEPFAQPINEPRSEETSRALPEFVLEYQGEEYSTHAVDQEHQIIPMIRASGNLSYTWYALITVNAAQILQNTVGQHIELLRSSSLHKRSHLKPVGKNEAPWSSEITFKTKVGSERVGYSPLFFDAERKLTVYRVAEAGGKLGPTQTKIKHRF